MITAKVQGIPDLREALRGIVPKLRVPQRGCARRSMPFGVLKPQLSRRTTLPARSCDTAAFTGRILISGAAAR